MGDFDPCECINILDHEGRMQRLLNLLRNSQSECTDNDCSLDGLGGPGVGAGSQSQFALIMVGWIVLAVVLYFMRPQRSRGEGQLKMDPTGRPNGGNGGQDPAPVM